MIHQCYFAESQRDRLFDFPVYRGCGIVSPVNPDLTRNCPELIGRKAQDLLCEYAAMLYIWRNPELDPDPWIGFTSYRQLDKSRIIFENRRQVETALAGYDVVGWRGYQFFDAPTGRPISMAEQGERFHPGLIACLYRVLMTRNEPVPREYLADNSGLFCNYWVMSKANFDEFMSWSYPLVRWCLNNADPYIASHPRSIGYLVERLFICWCASRGKRLGHVGELQTLRYVNPYSVAAISGEVMQPALAKLDNWSVSLLELCRRHRVAPHAIIHMGAHCAEEREVYRQLGVEDVLWIEADSDLIPQPGANVGAGSRHRTIEANVLDRYDFVVLNVQGAELVVLQGFGDRLHRFSGVHLKVNLKYSGCASLAEIDACLANSGLSRRETLITLHDDGDAFYLRDGAFDSPPADLTDRLRKAQLDLALKRVWKYRVEGQSPRTMELFEGNAIGSGKGEAEQHWIMRAAGHDIVLELVGVNGRSCCLRRELDGTWRGESLLPPRSTAELL